MSHDAGAVLVVPRPCRFEYNDQCERVDTLQLARVLARDGHMYTLQLTVQDLNDPDGTVVEKVVRADMEPGKSMLERALPVTEQRADEFVAATAAVWCTCQARLEEAGLARDASAKHISPDLWRQTPLTAAEIQARLQLEKSTCPASMRRQLMCEHAATTTNSTVYYTDKTCTECGLLLERCFDFDDRVHDKTAVYDFAWFAVHGSSSLEKTPRRFVQCIALMRAVVAAHAGEVARHDALPGEAFDRYDGA